MKHILIIAFVFLHLHTCARGVRKIPCPKIAPKNGDCAYQRKTGFAEYFCKRGYKLAGEKYRKCVRGKWEGELPLCVRNTCKTPTPPANGLIFPTVGNAVLNFFCMNGTKLEGPSVSYCIDDQWTPPKPSCIANDVQASLTCDFETDDLCGWSHDLNHDFDWTRHSLSTPTGHVFTGPKSDHTPRMHGKGYYMYIEATSRKPNDTARLISPVYPKQSNNSCLEFYYHMWGTFAGQLRVYLKKVNASWILKPEDAIFWKSSNQGPHWQRSLLQLPQIDEDFQIIVEAVRGSNYLSDLAIDDFAITENCNVDNPTESYTSTYWTDAIEYESLTCNSRCGTYSTVENKCNCTVDCEANKSCCPDYIPICILGKYFTDDYTSSEDYWTTDPGMTVDMEVDERKVPPVISASTVPTKLVMNITERTNGPTTSPPPTTTVTTTKLTTIKQTAKPTTKPTTTVTKSTTPLIITTKTIPTQRSTSMSTPMKTKSTAAAVIDSKKRITLPPKIDTNKNTQESDAVDVIPRPDYDDLDIITLSSLSNDEPPTKKPITQTSHKSMKAYWFVAIAICVAAVAVLASLLYRRYNYRGLKRRGHSDSQSDVRFLTSDEILDFNLAG